MRASARNDQLSTKLHLGYFVIHKTTHQLSAIAIHKHLSSVERVDIVWDVYKEDSLKQSTREKRGKGTRMRVTPSGNLPKDGPGFLRDAVIKQSCSTSWPKN